MKRIFLCLLALTVLCTTAILSACGGLDRSTAEGTSAETAGTAETAETAPSDAKFRSLMIGGTDLSAYTIVYARSNRADLLEKYPDGYPATEFHKETAERLSDLIHSLYGVRLPVVCDQETEEGEHEILVGRTNRPLSSTLSLKKLKEDKYTVCVSGDTLVICGGGYGSTWHAVDYVEELLRSAVTASDTYTFPADLLHNGTFDFIRIVCIGDSITEGVGVSEPTQYAYPAQLERWLWKDVLVENLGKSGKTMRDDLADSYMKTGSYKRVLQLAEETDVFTVMLGTNDGNRIGTGWSAEDSAAYKRDFEVLLRSISEKNPNARFVIMNCPTTFRDAAQNYDCAEIRALQAELVDEMNAKGYKTTFFDMHTVTEGLEEDYPDLLHPNDKGHTAMAKALAPALESLIETMRP